MPRVAEPAAKADWGRLLASPRPVRRARRKTLGQASASPDLTGHSRTCTVYLYTSRDAAMPTETTYTHARANLAALCDQVAGSREPVIIRRRGADDVALVDAAELRSLTETAHLLRSPNNPQRLIAALTRPPDQKVPPETIETGKRE